MVDTPERKRSPVDTDTPAACGIAVMGKASAPGRTKTRLVPPLSPAQAADLNTAFLKDMIGNLLRAGREMPIAPYVAFGPAGSEPFFLNCLPTNLPLIECSLPCFGDCLDRAITSLLERGHAAACVLNSDSPTLPTRLLVAAARSLAQTNDGVVIGPSTDGGYYLLGVKHAHRRLFDEIDWSTPRVFEQTLQRAAELALSVTILEPWYDVDDAAGLGRLRIDLAAARVSADGMSADGMSTDGMSADGVGVDGVESDRVSALVAGCYEAPCTREALARLILPVENACVAPALAQQYP